MTNFEKITASPEVLGEFLASLPVATGPWDKEFHRMFCDSCERENCDGKRCPHNAERGNPAWWLTQEAGEKQSQVVMWIKRDDYRKTMEELEGKIKAAREERIAATGDKSFTRLEALLTGLIEILLPEKRCRAVMDYDPDAERVTFSRLPAHDTQAGTR